MKKILQLIIQLLFLFLFILLVISGKVQLWMGILLLGIIASFIMGRIYCGWFCSINTAMRAVAWVKSKLHIKSIPIPKVLTKPWVRLLILALFAIVFAFTMFSGKKLPVLPILFGIGIILTLIFPEEFWHRYLCPYGTIMSFPSTKSRYNMKIDADKCNSCGICKRTCPAGAIEKKEASHIILKKDCLVCMDCSRKCKQNAISYNA